MFVIRQIGVLEAIIYILVAEYFPRILNTDVDMKSLVLVPLEILFVLLLLVVDLSIAKIGIILVIIYHIMAFFIAKYFGDTLFEIASKIDVSFLLDIVYFVSLFDILTSLVANVIN